jgi:hypothetical protein
MRVERCGESHRSTRRLLRVRIEYRGRALCKFATAACTASGAALAKARRSSADCMNRFFMPIGRRASRERANENLPPGLGRETYFDRREEHRLRKIDWIELALREAFPEAKSNSTSGRTNASMAIIRCKKEVPHGNDAAHARLARCVHTHRTFNRRRPADRL